MKRLLVNTQILVLLAGAQATAALDNATNRSVALPPVTQTNDPANAPDALRAYLEVQAQLQATQFALERTRQEAATNAVRAARELALRLDQMEQAHARDWQAAQDNNRVILIVAGAFAGFGVLAMLFTAYFQWRGLNRLTEVFVAAGGQRAFAPGRALPALGASELAIEPPSESTVRLLGVVERLEKRILELEHTAHPPIQDSIPPVKVSIEATAAPSADQTARIALLLGKGQSLLNLDQSDEALACFDEVLALDQNNTDALLKKGVALERQRKLTEAVECYDRAIAADSSMTIAYLYKGGVYNRLERFDEALACYEQALHTQENGKPA